MTNFYECPAEGCTLPASIEERGELNSTSGSVRMVKTQCVGGHWFLGPADTLLILSESDVTDDRLDLEFAYTSMNDSCRHPYSLVHYCRRPIGHEGEHAAGFGNQRVRWTD